MRGPDWTRRTFMGLLAAGALVPRRVLGSPELVLSNATLVGPDGRKIQAAGIRVRDGRIVEVGTGVTGGTDLQGAWIVPGFTDMGCRLGLVEIGMVGATHDVSTGKNQAPDARVVDGYNPRSELIDVTRVNGVTSVLVHPQLTGLVAGQAALMRTTGHTLSAAIIQAPAALCIQFGHAGAGGEGGISSRMGQAMALRKFMDDIKLPEGDGKKKNKKEEDLKPGVAVLRSFKRGELLALVKADRADDIERALSFIAEHELRAALVGCAEGHLLAAQIADSGLPAVLGPLDVQPASWSHPHARYENAAILHKAGVKIAFRTGDAHNVRNLPTLAGLAVAHGLPWEAAIQALSRNPMDILGRTDAGGLASGSEATFFVVDGDPLQPRHQVQGVWIDGVAQSMQTRQTGLYEQFKELK